MATIGEVMTREVATLGPDASVNAAAKLMVQGGFGSVVVVLGKMLLGILTERDVLRAAAEKSDLLEVPVSHWMTPEPDTATPDLDTEDAVVEMLSRGYRHLPVVGDGEVIGIVSLRDVLSVRIGRR